MSGLSAREVFRQERRRRQSLTFAVTGAFLMVLVVLSLGVLRGFIPVPFGQEFNAEVKYAGNGDVPCPPSYDVVDPAGIKVQVLNTTSRQGLAAGATDMLVSAGFAPLEAANSSPEYAGKVRITTGVRGVGAAYSVARFFPGSRVILTNATDALVVVELGTFYEGPLDEARVAEALQSSRLGTPPAGCLPVAEDALDNLESGQSGDGAESGHEAASADQASGAEN